MQNVRLVLGQKPFTYLRHMFKELRMDILGFGLGMVLMYLAHNYT